jgi:hypothetical protein
MEAVSSGVAFENASGDSGSFVRKQIVRDADLDIAGFTGKAEQRLSAWVRKAINCKTGLGR